MIHQQNTASNDDIVIAVIDDEATMEKHMPMGSEILLVSENPDCDRSLCAVKMFVSIAG